MAKALGTINQGWKVTGRDFDPQTGWATIKQLTGTKDYIQSASSELSSSGVRLLERQISGNYWELEGRFPNQAEEAASNPAVELLEVWTKTPTMAQIDIWKHPTVQNIENRINKPLGKFLKAVVDEYTATLEANPTVTDAPTMPVVSGITTPETAFLNVLLYDMASGVESLTLYPFTLNKSLTIPYGATYTRFSGWDGKMLTATQLLAHEPGMSSLIQAEVISGYYLKIPGNVETQSDGRTIIQTTYEWTLDFARSAYELAS